MTARPRNDYKDPLVRMIEAEERTCKGCIHLERAELAQKAYCGNPAVRTLTVNVRCDEYEEIE